VPLEDVRMKGELPPGMRKPSARFWWELQHTRLPQSLAPWSPLWVTGPFLETAECLPDGALKIGECTVGALVADSRYLDISVLKALARISAAGGRLILSRAPMEPGRSKRPEYSRLVDGLSAGTRTCYSADPQAALRDVPPFLDTEDAPDFFVRETDGDFAVFVAHPAARSLTYPMPYGASAEARAERRQARFFGANGNESDLTMDFQAGGSVLFRAGRRGGIGSVGNQHGHGSRIF
jgi:hypothetical protein